MAGNSFGQLFRITTFGESHGKGLGVVIDGMPAGFSLLEEDIQKQLDRRKPAQSHLTTSRKEKDTIKILSGVFERKTTGTPILLMVYNHDQRSKEYDNLKDLYRPSHADLTYEQKYGFRDWRGGGRASARETLARVAAGAIAQKYLKEFYGIEILSYVEQLGDIVANINDNDLSIEKIESSLVRCPDLQATQKMSHLIKSLKQEGDSIGAIVKSVIRGVPSGWGEPVFDKLQADLAKAMMSINAVKGFEVGAGFSSVSMKGSQYNDLYFLDQKGKIRTKTNHSGGILGGISTGEDIYFRIAFKPIASIQKEQSTLNIHDEQLSFQIKGRHDISVVPRAIPIVDAMAAIVLMDHGLRQKSQFNESIKNTRE